MIENPEHLPVGFARTTGRGQVHHYEENEVLAAFQYNGKEGIKHG
jgi:hypothetical protein